MRCRIYLIDDHALVREGLRTLLQTAGHEVVGESEDPSAASVEIARLEPDVVLLDLHLGRRSGFDLFDDARRRAVKARIVVLTMSQRPQHIADALRLGAHGYVLKGSSSAELLRAVEAAARGERHLGPDEAELAVRGLTEAAYSARALSARERQVVVMVARGASSSEIGEQLHLSPKTVDTYRSRLMRKLGLADAAALVRWAVREGMVDLDER